MQGGRGKVEAGDTAETVAETVGREQRSTFTGYLHFYFFMAALHSRCRHYIFILWFLLLSSFFPHVISAVAD